MPTNCNGECTGSVWGFDVTDGVEPYTFMWEGNGMTYTYADVGGLCPGTYCVTVTDGNGCTATDCVDVVDSPMFTTTTTSTDAACNGGSNSGTATANPSGGSGPYTYSWDNGGMTQTITDLSAGTYCVTVTDSQGCTATSCTIVDGGLEITLTGMNVSCNGGNDGSATATGSGGTMPYSYLWSNGSTLSGISNLTAGQYCVTVTDASGCMVDQCIDVTEPNQLTVSYQIGNETCLGDGNGFITSTGSGGTMPYTYSWSGGESTSNLSNLDPGNYGLTLTDANGCQITDLIPIGTDGISSCTATESGEISMPGAADGSALASGSGGSMPYTYLWSNGDTNQEANGLSAGNYDVTITDATGCQCVASVFLMDPGTLGDQVWSDDNHNGIQDAGELPLSEVFVSLTGTDAEGILVKKEMYTDESGAYEFENVRPGDYRVNFVAPPGYRPTTQFSGNNNSIDNDIDETGSTGLISLAAGEVLNDIDAGFYPCTMIGNRVWEDVNQNGIQEDNEPGVENVLVEAWSSGSDHVFGTSDDVVRGSAISDANGYYTIDCIRPGSSYRLSLSYEGLNSGEWLISSMDAGNSDNNNDFNEEGITDEFDLNPGLVELRSFDAGIFKVCNDFADAGIIQEADQTICYGETAKAFELNTQPEGGYGEFTYTWMMSTNADNTNNGDWTVIDGATAATYAPGVIYETTHFVRMAKRDGCDVYTKGTNVATITIADAGTNNCIDHTQEIVLEAYPNPATEFMTLLMDLPLEKDATLELLSSTGKLMSTQRVAEGTYTLDLDFSDLPQGLYIVKIQYNDSKVITVLKAFKM